MSKQRYINRDLSWLSFNERVLQEAEDTTNSLNERLKFLAIFSSNLDEFYRVRVSKLREFRRLQKGSPIRLKERPKKIIKQIQKKVDQLQKRFGHIYKEKLLKELMAEGVQLIEASEFNSAQKEFSTAIFHSEIKPHINVFQLDKIPNLDFIKDKSLFFFSNFEDTPLLISIPSNECGRFVSFPKENKTRYITFLDEIIRHNITEVLPHEATATIHSVKITRDGELYYDEEDDTELVQLIKKSLKDRDLGLPTRVFYDNSMPKVDVKVLRKMLHLKKTDVMPGGRFHNFSDFFGFPEIETRIATTSSAQIAHPVLGNSESVIAQIKDGDQLLSFPFHKYNPILRLLDEASEKDEVTHIYITLYRVSKDSAVANGLLKCLANGKKVTVFVEAKARFDEENNIEWGEKLTKVGATVLYSMPALKVHSKIMLIEATDGDIAYIGTGNFNEKSAKIYTDFSLLTANNNIANDLKEVFKFLLNTAYEPNVQHIWMSPFTTRQQLYNRIDNEIEIAKRGGEGFLFFKMNSLEDKGVIDKLYQAASAGVDIRLLVRGICCLNPSFEAANGNIKVVSIVGKYLEHSRVYLFGNDGKYNLFIGSADCMERNLDRRVEVITPVFDEAVKNTIRVCLDLQWFDNTKARLIDGKQKNSYQKEGKSQINAQQDFKEYLHAEYYPVASD